MILKPTIPSDQDRRSGPATPSTGTLLLVVQRSAPGSDAVRSTILCVAASCLRTLCPWGNLPWGISPLSTRVRTSPPGGIAVRCLAPGACTNPYKHNQTLQDAPRGAPHRNPPINVGKNELSRKYRYRFDLPPTSTRRLPDTDATSTGHIRWSTPLSTCKVHLRPSADHNARRGRRDSQRDRIGNAPKSKIRARSARRKRHYKRKSLHDQRSGVNKKPRRQSLRGIPYR